MRLKNGSVKQAVSKTFIRILRGTVSSTGYRLWENLFRSGPMKLCFVDKGESSDHIIIPGRKTTVISVSPKSPRDKIMKALSP